MTGDITVDTYGGLYRIQARRYGPFAVHRTVLSDGSQGRTWALTHVRTGRAIDFSIPHEAAAMSLARALVAARLNWRFTSPARVSARTRAVSRAIQQRHHDRWFTQQQKAG